MKTFAHRLAALEALETAQQPGYPPLVVMHGADWTALEDPTTPADIREAIQEAYQLGGTQQSIYVNLCDGYHVAEACRVCDDRPVVKGYEHE